MSTAIGEVAVEASEILDRVKGDRPLLIVDIQQLLQVEYLDMMVIGLATNDYVVLVGSDLTPLTCGGSCSLRKTAKISQLASSCDLLLCQLIIIRKNE